jgi:hypothetical protein
VGQAFGSGVDDEAVEGHRSGWVSDALILEHRLAACN